MSSGSWFRFFAASIIFIIGAVFVALEMVESVSLPDNMNAEAISLGVQEEDVV